MVFSDIQFEDGTRLISREMQTFMHWFVINTTERILYNASRLNIKDTGALQRSIRGTVYTNAGGNEALVRIFFLNYGRYLEYGLGRNMVYDRDLDADDGTKEGIKITNVERPLVVMSDRNYGPQELEFHGTTRGGKPIGSERGEHHKARPFIMNSIAAEVWKMSRRLAENFAYTSAVHMSRTFIRAIYDEEQKMFIDADTSDAEWLRNLRLTQDTNNKSAEQLRRELHAMALSEFAIE